MVERRTVDAVVAGSNPVIRPKKPQREAGALVFNMALIKPEMMFRFRPG